MDLIEPLQFFDENIPCLAACPVHTNAGLYVAAIADGEDHHSYLTARLPNPFASVCGRVCAAPCEDACRRGEIDRPIAIRALKRFVTEKYGVEAGGASEWDDPRSAPPQERTERVAIVGAGGIGFDVAEFLVHEGESPTLELPLWMREWGVGDPAESRGGLAPEGPRPEAPARQVTLLQRKAERPGRRLGKTTGWIHRAALKMKNVEMIGGVNYERIDDAGLHVSQGEARENPRLIEADNIVLCAGQLPERGLADALEQAGLSCHVIGGADVAAELDAKRAIDQGTRLAAGL